MYVWSWPDIFEVAAKRTALGITQQDLSTLSGIHQSVISRIEEGKISDPSFNTMKKLFAALDQCELNPLMKRKGKAPEKEPVAEDLMNPKVESIKPYQKAKEAWTIMKKKNFSQLPVIDDNGKVLGGISEASHLQVITEADHQGGINNRQQEITVQEIMEDTFFIVGRNVPLAKLASILGKVAAVLVMNRGKIIGIITKYDLVDNVYRNRPGAFR